MAELALSSIIDCADNNCRADKYWLASPVVSSVECHRRHSGGGISNGVTEWRAAGDGGRMGGPP